MVVSRRSTASSVRVSGSAISRRPPSAGRPGWLPVRSSCAGGPLYPGSLALLSRWSMAFRVYASSRRVLVVCCRTAISFCSDARAAVTGSSEPVCGRPEEPGRPAVSVLRWRWSPWNQATEAELLITYRSHEDRRRRQGRWSLIGWPKDMSSQMSPPPRGWLVPARAPGVQSYDVRRLSPVTGPVTLVLRFADSTFRSVARSEMSGDVHDRSPDLLRQHVGHD